MSTAEAAKVMLGDSLVNDTDWAKRGAHTNSKGFCFLPESQEVFVTYTDYVFDTEYDEESDLDYYDYAQGHEEEVTEPIEIGKDEALSFLSGIASSQACICIAVPQESFEKMKEGYGIYNADYLIGRPVDIKIQEYSCETYPEGYKVVSAEIYVPNHGWRDNGRREVKAPEDIVKELQKSISTSSVSNERDRLMEQCREVEKIIEEHNKNIRKERTVADMAEPQDRRMTEEDFREFVRKGVEIPPDPERVEEIREKVMGKLMLKKLDLANEKDGIYVENSRSGGDYIVFGAEGTNTEEVLGLAQKAMDSGQPVIDGDIQEPPLTNKLA